MTVTHSPRLTRARPTSARYAVANRHPRLAAVAKSTWSGRATRLLSAACSATYSANEPQWVNPGCSWSGQTWALPSRHHEHRPQPQTNGTVTRSPTCHRVTPAPVSTTSPASSCPGTCGNAMSSCPAQACQSLRHIPVAATRTTTPPAGADGSGTSVTRGCDPAASTTIARTATPYAGLTITPRRSR